MSLIKSLASIIGPRENEQIASAILGELDTNDDTAVPKYQIPFQYFPETIQDSRSVEYVSKVPVGSSHPIYQWVGGSPRSISFQAVLTADLQPPSKIPSSSTQDNFAKAASKLESFGAAVSSVIKSPAGAFGGLIQNKAGTDIDRKYNIDIGAYIAWLRAKTYPVYSAKYIAPPKLVLYLPNSGIVGAKVAGLSIRDSIFCIMTNCNVTYEAFFHNGAPRIAVVDLEFVEIIQVGNNWGYVTKDALDAHWKNEDILKTIKVNSAEIPWTSPPATSPGKDFAVNTIKNGLISKIKSLA